MASVEEALDVLRSEADVSSDPLDLNTPFGYEAPNEPLRDVQLVGKLGNREQPPADEGAFHAPVSLAEPRAATCLAQVDPKGKPASVYLRVGWLATAQIARKT